MSGRRCKAMRKFFTKAFGRKPHRGMWTDKGVQVLKSEWRTLKRVRGVVRESAA